MSEQRSPVLTGESLASKMAEVAAECGFAQFDAQNDFHKYKYASAASIIRQVNKALTKRGIALSVRSELLHFEKGHAVVRLTGEFTDGVSVLETQAIGEGTDKGDKAIYKANTGAYKYLLAHALVMAWGAEDPEADSSTDEATSSKASPAKARSSSKKTETKSEPAAEKDGPSILERIKAAADMTVLTSLKEEIKGMETGSDARKAAIAAFKAREQEVSS